MSLIWVPTEEKDKMVYDAFNDRQYDVKIVLGDFKTLPQVSSANPLENSSKQRQMGWGWSTWSV